MKITEFLKKTTTIDKKFIDDFFKFHDYGKSEYDYTIKLDIISDWLRVKTNSDIYKIGKTIDFKNRISQYNVGNIKEFEIVYVLKTEKIDEIEQCVKMNLKKHAVKYKSNELIKLNLERIQETIEYCN